MLETAAIIFYDTTLVVEFVVLMLVIFLTLWAVL